MSAAGDRAGRELMSAAGDRAIRAGWASYDSGDQRGLARQFCERFDKAMCAVAA